MEAERHIRIKRNLFLVEEEKLLCFQRTYGKGIEFPNNAISSVFLNALNKNTNYSKIVNELSNGTGLQKMQVETVLDKWIELGLLENFEDTDKVLEQTERYSRQIAFFDSMQPLPRFEDNVAKLNKLRNTHILIIGIGGIGNYAALSLAAMGVGRITLIDGDKVERSNLSRQVIFTSGDINAFKVNAAVEHLKKINPECVLQGYADHIETQEQLEDLIKRTNPDLVFISADKPILPFWTDELSIKYHFSFITCSYQSYTGFVGPIISSAGKRYGEVIPKRKQLLNDQSALVEKTNTSFQHPSSSASNAILANMAVLESVKYILGIGRSNVLEKRCVFNLDRFEMRYE
jgi:molybdopterin-synthase adenylyltransferase